MSIEEKVIDYLKEAFRLDEVRLEMNFQDDLGFDSLDIVDLVSYLEETLDTRITDEELLQINTVKDAVDFLIARGAEV